MDSDRDVELGLIAGGSDEGAARADAIVEKLRQSGKPVTGEGPIWKVFYEGFESYDTAREALRGDLTSANGSEDWTEVLSIDSPS